VHLGIRPEHIHIGEGEGAPFPVTVLHVERLGDVSLLYVQASVGAPVGLTVRVEGSVRPEPGTAITLRLRPAHLHLFDAAGVACHRTVELPT
jgi:ABC-type sugar transport system ATPase subunit